MDAARFAIEHDAKGRPYPTDKRMKANAADDLLTTIEDYAKFGISVMNEVGLSGAIFEEMIKPQAAMKGGAFMGLGWELQRELNKQKKEYALIHSGSDKGVERNRQWLRHCFAPRFHGNQESSHDKGDTGQHDARF